MVRKKRVTRAKSSSPKPQTFKSPRGKAASPKARSASTRHPTARRGADPTTGAGAVDAFVGANTYAKLPEVQALRGVILGAHPGIREGIKWNGPSFHFKDYFATIALRSKDFVQVVLHKGAKVKDGSTAGMKIDDRAGLLEWHAKERASAKFSSVEEIRAKAADFRVVVRQWIAQM